MKARRLYRLERGAYVVTFTTEAKAREAVKRADNLFDRPGQAWRITLRADKGRKTTLIAEGTF